MTQINKFDLVLQDTLNDRIFSVVANGDPNFTGEHSLSLLVTSVEHPNDIKPFSLTVKITVNCVITQLLEDGSSGFSPVYQILLPQVD